MNATIPKFHNAQGCKDITIGVKKFACIGTLPPLDHPHVYLNMGQEAKTVCPYCSTVYLYEESLQGKDKLPKDFLWQHGA